METETMRRDMFEVTRDGQRVGLFYDLDEARSMAARIVRAFPLSPIRVWEAEVEFSGESVASVNRGGMAWAINW